MSIAAGILLQAVASTGAVDAEPVEDTPTEVATSDAADASDGDASASADASADSEAVVDEMESLPTVAVGADTEAPNALPRGVPEETDSVSEPTERTRVTARGGGAQPGGDWEFEFHGYFRAPMRIGVGQKLNPAMGQSDRSVHYPVVPDDNYFSYQYTLHNPRDWAELYFGYGNKIATGYVSIQGFNFTDAAWTEVNAQFGVAQAFVALTPKFRAKWFDLKWKIGSFDNRYGEAGRYDAGEFETYLFGRTHGTGEAGRITFALQDKKKKRHVIGVEHGIQVNRPNPARDNPHRFTFMHHWHLDYTFDNKVEVGFHYLHAFAKEADRLGANSTYVGDPDGAMHVLGPDFRFDWGRIGYLYAGLSYIKAVNARVVGPAIEVIHSRGGGFQPANAGNQLLGYFPGGFSNGIVDNYLQGPNKQGTGNGEIITLLAQLEHSVKRAMKGKKWDGESWDVAAKFYLMYNHIKSDDGDNDGSNRVKYGVDVLGTPLKWLGVGLRFTQVRPHSKIPNQNFSIISPRLVFKSDWISRETIEVSYSRYIYRQRACEGVGTVNEDGDFVPPEVFYECVQPPPNPSGPESFGSSPTSTMRGQPGVLPDENVFMVKATFWW